MRVTVTGDKALQAGLRRAATQLARLDKPTREATRAVARQAARLAPKRTGRLARTNRPRNSGGLGAVENRTRYAGYVENGTRYMREQPYLRPALTLTPITDIYESHARDSIRHL
ncbi:HK97-gp10 family putative phage morphogenesis protein [Gordonia sp. CPCC 205333]|uniref:HK97-gp10 family putative phage morphogenesis protein n=1 Tax=Gordonia sp. CPCC 205333 TaxID=3140790 RepID=UPI003AF390BB